MAPPLPARVAAALFALLLPAVALAADDLGQLEAGITAYENNRFDECISRFQVMLTPGSPSELKERENKNRARIHFAACLSAKKRTADADEQMRAILRDDLDYQPNAAAFPSGLIGRFKALRQDFQEEIDKATAERLAREAKEREEREAKERAERERRESIEAMAREQVLITRSSRALALVPFGVGQLQNRQTNLGWLLLGTEAALAATTVVSYAIKTNIDRDYKPSVSDPAEARKRSDAATLVNRLSFGAFVGVAVAGVVHAQLTFVPEFRETLPRELPPPITAEALPGGGMVSWQGVF